MNLELDEEYGAGFEGTKALLYKYIKDTPGQNIQQYMKTKSLSEILKKSDPVGDWIRDFIDSDDARFAGKTKKERINMALGAYYAAQRNESISEGDAKSYAYSTVVSKLKDGSWETSYDVKQGRHLEVTDSATKKRITIFVEAVITDTVEEQTKTDDKKMSYTAQVRQANKDDRAKRATAWRKVFSNLRKEEAEETQKNLTVRIEIDPLDDVDPDDFADYVKARAKEGVKAADQGSYISLSGPFNKVRSAVIAHYDNAAEAEKYHPQIKKKDIKEAEEDEIELEESAVSASQINRYIDTENWKAIADLMKGLNDDEHELWAKNGYDGRTYELMMKSRERSKSYKDAVEKMKNILGVNESVTECEKFDEELELFESENKEQLNEELLTTLAGYYLALKLLPLATVAILIAVAGVSGTIALALKGTMAVQDALEKAKAKPISTEKAEVLKRLEKFQETLKKKPEKAGLIKKAANVLLTKIKKKVKNTNESIELDEMQELYAVVDTTDGTVVATASSEDGAKRSIRSAHLPPISSEHPGKLKIVKTKKTAQVGYPIKEETNELTEKIDVEELLDAAVALRKKNPQLRKGQSIMIALHGMDKKAYDNARNKADAFNNDSKIPQLIQLLDPSYYKEEKNLEESPSLETLRLMKIVSLATGSKDTDALYEYALTSPSYSSLVELKENFNKYIQDA